MKTKKPRSIGFFYKLIEAHLLIMLLPSKSPSQSCEMVPLKPGWDLDVHQKPA